jgi:hypothetical protein
MMELYSINEQIRQAREQMALRRSAMSRSGLSASGSNLRPSDYIRIIQMEIEAAERDMERLQPLPGQPPPPERYIEYIQAEQRRNNALALLRSLRGGNTILPASDEDDIDEMGN